MDESPLFRMRSGITGVAWPPLAHGPAATLAALMHELEASQFWPRERIAARQFQQLAVLADHAAAQSPFFAKRLRQAGVSPRELASLDDLRRLPLLTRRDVQTAGASFYCATTPPEHMPVRDTKTSGSTGEPVVVRKTAITYFFWMACTLREHFWHRRDFADRIMTIRANIDQPKEQSDWGPPVNLLFASGPARIIGSMLDAQEQLREIRKFRPGCILTYPNNLAGLITECEREGDRLDGLKFLWSFAETLSPELRARAEAHFGVPVQENYSSQELGIIAVQCPTSGLLHVMSENAIVEVLDERGVPCRAGEVGQVAVTDLHNFASPLVRYAVGDYAEVGGDCPCGRTLPTLKRIVGRDRNLIVWADGTRHWPQLGFRKYRDVAPVSQFQFIQHDVGNIEVRLVVERPLAKTEEAALRAVILEALTQPFAISFTYFNGALPRGANGKFEEFICKVPR